MYRFWVYNNCKTDHILGHKANTNISEKYSYATIKLCFSISVELNQKTVVENDALKVISYFLTTPPAHMLTDAAPLLKDADTRAWIAFSPAVAVAQQGSYPCSHFRSTPRPRSHMCQWMKALTWQSLRPPSGPCMSWWCWDPAYPILYSWVWLWILKLGPTQPRFFPKPVCMSVSGFHSHA